MTTYTPTPGGPRPGNQKCGPSRRLRLTPDGLRIVTAARRAAYLDRLGWRGDAETVEWIDIPTTFLPEVAP